jgi:uracil-DNA glycosylase
MTDSQKTRKLSDLNAEIVNFKKSPLYQYRIENKNFPVIGEGSENAKIFFIGEAPGKNEAETGKPFCGKSGKVLDHLLKSIQVDRKDVYVTNIVKDRPQENRDPTKEEIALYTPFLDREIDIIEPMVIVTLGRFSMDYLMKKFGVISDATTISELHGKVFDIKASYGTVRLIPLYHPAVAVYNANKIDELKTDFAVLKKWL